MQLRVLGCSGGIGDANHTTAYMLDRSVLIDAGTGVGQLSFDELMQIEHVFLSHAHFDHIACLPTLLDTVIGRRGGTPITVHASEETIAALREHVFNWHIWPDFSLIPDESNAILRFEPHALGETHTVAGCRVTAIPAEHTVPATGFRIESGTAAVIYSGDSTGGAAFWAAVNATPNLVALIIETAFPDRESVLAKTAKHLCPATLQQELAQLDRAVPVLITHLKPADSDLIMQEIAALGLPARRLMPGEIIEF